LLQQKCSVEVVFSLLPNSFLACLLSRGGHPRTAEAST
jgi:hypothetical protein